VLEPSCALLHLFFLILSYYFIPIIFHKWICFHFIYVCYLSCIYSVFYILGKHTIISEGVLELRCSILSPFCALLHLFFLFYPIIFITIIFHFIYFCYLSCIYSVFYILGKHTIVSEGVLEPRCSILRPFRNFGFAQ
jgi:hypothetical protein